MIIIILFTIIKFITSASVSPIWVTDTNVQSGTAILVVNYGLTSGSSLVGNSTLGYGIIYSFNINFGTKLVNFPRVTIGLNSFQLNSSYSGNLTLINDYTSVSLSSYTHALTLDFTNYVKSVSISYLAIDQISDSYFRIGSLSTVMNIICCNSGPRHQTWQVTPASDVFNLTNENGLIIWLKSFVMDSGGNPYTGNLQFGAYAVIDTPILYNLTFYTDGVSRVYYGGYSRLFFDLTLIQQTQKNFFDYGNIVGVNSLQNSWPSIVQLVPNGFFFGLSHFNFSSNSPTIQFTQQLSSPYNITSTSGYLNLNLTYWNFRVRTCPTGYPLYHMQTQNCYDLCPPSTYANITYSFCGTCHYSCLNCTSAAFDSCIACDPNMYRNLSSNLCICITGYYDNNTALCDICDPTCLTCDNNTYIDCLTCDISLNRIFYDVDSSCPCDVGYFDYGNYTCVLCSDYMVGCIECIPGQGLLCITCDTYFLFDQYGNCICNSTSFLNISICQNCTTYMIGCLSCTDSMQCMSCDYTLFFELNSSYLCSCQSGYYFYSTNNTCLSCIDTIIYYYFYNPQTQLCQLCDPTCLTCNGSTNSNCISCNNTVSNLVNTSCICISFAYLNVTLGCDLCDPSCLTCNGSLNTNCLTCDTEMLLILNVTSCVCDIGYFYNLTTLQCDPCNQTCLTCTGPFFDNCSSCSPPLLINNNSCFCPNQTYMDLNFICTACDVSCQTCNGNSSNNCLSCFDLFTLVNTSCVCINGYYYSSQGECLPCDISCLNCSGPSIYNCTACNINLSLTRNSSCVCSLLTQFVNSLGNCSNCDPTCGSCSGNLSNQCLSCILPFQLNGTNFCTCPSNTYLDVTLPTIGCSSCDYTCLQCDGSLNTNCLTCNQTNNRTFLNSNNSCKCNIFYMDVGTSICAPLVCSTGFVINSSGVCEQICGDGILFSGECDDGNQISGDGCSSICTTETNYTCFGGSSSSISVCSYNQPLTINLVNQIKDPSSNTLTITYQIGPSLSSLNNSNIQNFINCTVPNNNIKYNYNNGTLTAVISYNSSIQSQTFNLSFVSPNNGTFQYTPSTAMSFVVDPYNNVGAFYYNSNVYTAVGTSNLLANMLIYLSFGSFFIGFFTYKFIGVEMIGVVQIAYIGLIIVNYIQPLLAPLLQITLINGINNFFSQNNQNILVNQVPIRVSALSYQSEVVYNLNYMVILILIPIFIAFILFILSKVLKKYQQKLISYSYMFLCQYLLTVMIFCLYQITTSSGLFIQYQKKISQVYYFNIAEIVLIGVILIAVIILYYKKPKHFGQYKLQFKQDKFSQHYYYILIGERILTSGILASGNQFNMIGYIAIVVSVISFIILVLKKPYLRNYNNYRAYMNQLVIIAILGMYSYYRVDCTNSTQISSLSIYMPYAQIAMLYFVIIINTICMIKTKYDNCKQNNPSYKQKQNQELLNKTKINQQKAEEQFLQQSKQMVMRMGGLTGRPLISGRTFAPTYRKIEVELLNKTIIDNEDNKNNTVIEQKNLENIIQNELNEQKQQNEGVEEQPIQIKEFTKVEMKQIDNDFDAI